MLTHEQIWNAIDRLAIHHSMTASGLAKSAGLDATAFNKSKRFSPDGRPRWPSTESISKIMLATGANLEEFFGQITGNAINQNQETIVSIPFIGFAQAGSGGYFDVDGSPVGDAWQEIDFPATEGKNLYALEVQGDSMLPLYRDGDTLVIEPDVSIRKGDRVVVKSLEGEVMAKILNRHTSKIIELLSLNPEHPTRTFAPSELEWMARIVWASQ